MPPLSPEAHAVAQRLLNDSFPRIMSRSPTAWQAFDTARESCCYSHSFNGGCAIGCLLPASFPFATIENNSIDFLFHRSRRLDLRDSILQALNIPSDLIFYDINNDVPSPLSQFCRDYQRAHDRAAGLLDFASRVTELAAVYGLTLPPYTLAPTE